MKITKATLKRFIREQLKLNNLYIKQLSSFDGMTDCVMPTNYPYKKVETVNWSDEYNFGIKGLWLVNHSRDYFDDYMENGYVGIKISNACGSAILARKT